jgi:hypothetical protein
MHQSTVRTHELLRVRLSIGTQVNTRLPQWGCVTYLRWPRVSLVARAVIALATGDAATVLVPFPRLCGQWAVVALRGWDYAQFYTNVAYRRGLLPVHERPALHGPSRAQGGRVCSQTGSGDRPLGTAASVAVFSVARLSVEIRSTAAVPFLRPKAISTPLQQQPARAQHDAQRALGHPCRPR